MGELHIDGFSNLVPIGTGGFSTVYSAVQNGLNRTVAIKVLDGLHTDKQRFERECSILGSLSNVPGIVSVYQATYTSDGRPAIVMEYMQNGSLADQVTRHGPLPVDLVLQYGQTISTALSTAHAKGVFHRDIKPENVLFGSRGVALADFGIAICEENEPGSLTEASLSPQHGAPERFTGQDAHPIASDIYSLGSTLYFALTGVPPFGSSQGPGGIAGLIDRIMNHAVPPIPRADVTPELQQLLAWSMAKNPAARIPSMAEFARALQSLQGQRSHGVANLPNPDRAVGPNNPENPTVVMSHPAPQFRVPQSTPPQQVIQPTALAPVHYSEPVSARAPRSLAIPIIVLFLVVALGSGAIVAINANREQSPFVGADGYNAFGAEIVESSTTTTTLRTPTSTTMPRTTTTTTAVTTTTTTSPTIVDTGIDGPEFDPMFEPTVPLLEDELMWAVDEYLDAASSFDTEYFVDQMAYPIKLYYSHENADIAFVRERTEAYWLNNNYLDFSVVDYLEMRTEGDRYHTVTRYRAEIVRADGSTYCGYQDITLIFNSYLRVEEVTERQASDC